MKINIWGYGGELVVGSVTREQYVYWKMQEEEELNDHVLGNNDPDDIDESLCLGEWYDIDNIEHMTGASYDSTTHITVENDSGEEIFSMPVTQLDSIPGCEEIIQNEYGFDSDDQTHEFVFMAYSAEKGSFGGLSVPVNEFDPKKLKITVRQIEGFELIDSISYDHPDTTDSDDYSTSGKSWECWLFSTKGDEES